MKRNRPGVGVWRLVLVQYKSIISLGTLWGDLAITILKGTQNKLHSIFASSSKSVIKKDSLKKNTDQVWECGGFKLAQVIFRDVVSADCKCCAS